MDSHCPQAPLLGRVVLREVAPELREGLIFKGKDKGGKREGKTQHTEERAVSASSSVNQRTAGDCRGLQGTEYSLSQSDARRRPRPQTRHTEIKFVLPLSST